MKRLLAAVIVTVLGLLGTAVPAAAAPTLMAIKNAMTGRCLDSNGSTIFTSASCSSSTALWYTVPYQNGPTYAIKSYAFGFCIRINVANNDIVRDCGSFARWYSAFDGQYDMIKNAEIGLVLDSNFAGDVYAHSSNGGLYQKWRWIVR